MIFIEGDVRPITNVLGTWKTITKDFSNRRNLGILTDLAAETALQTFAEHADRSAEADAAALGHMYEWGQLGEESGRLWYLVLAGNGSNKLASFNYKKAQEESPRNANDQDLRGSHVFYWKAPITELGVRTVQRPREDGVLAIPSREPLNNKGNIRQSGGTMWFSKRSVTTNPAFAARGSFTELWMTYFAGVAQRVAQEAVEETAEAFFNNYSKGYSQFQPKVNPKPTSPKLLVKSKLGETYGRRKNGQFMNKAEKVAQLLRAQRVADGLA